MLKTQWRKSDKPILYDEALNYMEKRVNDIIINKKGNLIWFLEHEEIYTAGTSAVPTELLLPELLPVYLTNRGGKYTYHGPGQRIIYFILNLKEIFVKPDIAKLIFLLEEIIIKSLEKIGIIGFRKNKMTGVWVKENDEEKKIASLGMRVRKWVCYHGVAINYNPNLSRFYGIIPCGIKNHDISSIVNFTNKYSMDDFDIILKNSIETIFSEVIE